MGSTRQMPYPSPTPLSVTSVADSCCYFLPGKPLDHLLPVRPKYILPHITQMEHGMRLFIDKLLHDLNIMQIPAYSCARTNCR